MGLRRSPKYEALEKKGWRALVGIERVYNFSIDSEENLWLAEFLSGEILQFDPHLKIKKKLGPLESGFLEPDESRLFQWEKDPKSDPAKRLKRPHAAFAHASSLFVSEYSLGRVSRFDLHKPKQILFGKASDPVSLNGPTTTTVINEYVYVGNSKGGTIVRYSLEGKFAGWMGAYQDAQGNTKTTPGFVFDLFAPVESTVAGGFKNAHTVKMGPDGLLYVADSGNHRIYRCDFDGNTGEWIGGGEKRGWTSHGEPVRGHELGYLNTPTAFEFGPNGELIVLDTENHRIQEFTIDGQPLRWWGVQEGTTTPAWHTEGKPISSPAPRAFRSPFDMFLHKGKFWVADTHNKRIQIFSLPQ